jgi:hypothetical protein
LRFLLDENLPRAFAHALHALAVKDGHVVDHVLDLVESGTADRVWITLLAREGAAGVAISGDRRMLTRKHELHALEDSRITAFILAPGWSRLRFWEKASLLVQRWPAIVTAAGTYPAGSIFIVPHRQTLAPLKPHSLAPAPRGVDRRA